VSRLLLREANRTAVEQGLPTGGARTAGGYRRAP
jgi:hypothetical protein